MKRLGVQLTLAFSLIVLVMVATVALLADLTAGHAFRRYLTYSDTSLHQNLSTALIEYYQAQGSWQGIDRALEQVRVSLSPRRPLAPPEGSQQPRDDPLQIVLADASGRILYDSHDDRTGKRLTRDERAAAYDLELDGQVIGQLVVAIPMQTNALGPLEQAFISRQRGFLAIGALLAGILGTILGLAISRNLTAPLQRLAIAARRVANRDFCSRVEIEGSAEVSEVARAFNEMASALEQAEHQRQNLVADVAHELRTPLSVLQGNLQAILDDVYPLEKSEISRLYDETRLLSRLVGDLRELALADAGQLGLNFQTVDPAPLLQAQIENLALAAEAGEVELKMTVPADLPSIEADPDRVSQIVRNLLVNALQHTPPGGAVTLSAQRQDDRLQISVSDTGEGLSEKDLPHVFDRFWRADRSRTRGKRDDSGSGLGLAIAQSLVKAHGGQIWVESEAHQGSSFHFSLPLAPNPGP
jgi:two-component system OmpR family sensor kinase/two-component system sensor histidine kinase BaeS